MFAAGNYGDLQIAGASRGMSTVTSPSTCKNCLAVGATPTASEQLRFSVTLSLANGKFNIGGKPFNIKLVLADFGASLAPLVGSELPVRTTLPADACSALSGDADGAVLLVERGAWPFFLHTRTKSDGSRFFPSPACLPVTCPPPVNFMT